MTLISLILTLSSISMAVVAQILLKQGMSSPAIAGAFAQGVLPGLLTTFSNFFVLSGLLAYVSSAGLWLGVLAKVDVSKAYPFVGLGFIGTMLFAYWFLNEPITGTKLVGTALIVLGVYFISR